MASFKSPDQRRLLFEKGIAHKLFIHVWSELMIKPDINKCDFWIDEEGQYLTISIKVPGVELGDSVTYSFRLIVDAFDRLMVGDTYLTGDSISTRSILQSIV